MRLNRRQRPATVAMDMTPMIDVVFQLIIFFMTATQMAQQQNEPLNLPQQAGQSEEFESTVKINVNAQGEIKVAAETMSLDQLEKLVREAVARKGSADKVSVVVRVDRSNKSAAVNKVFLMLKRVGIQSSRIAVEVPAS